MSDCRERIANEQPKEDQANATEHKKAQYQTSELVLYARHEVNTYTGAQENKVTWIRDTGASSHMANSYG
jgi:hypothetical protein